MKMRLSKNETTVHLILQVLGQTLEPRDDQVLLKYSLVKINVPGT